jgi:hypothetical protein
VGTTATGRGLPARVAAIRRSRFSCVGGEANMGTWGIVVAAVAVVIVGLVMLAKFMRMKN